VLEKCFKSFQSRAFHDRQYEQDVLSMLGKYLELYNVEKISDPLQTCQIHQLWEFIMRNMTNKCIHRYINLLY